MKQLVAIKSTQPEQHLNIGWATSNVCNFKCRYCFPGSNEGDVANPQDVDLVVNNISHVIEHYRTNLDKQFFHLTILGGEPTVWRDFDRFLEKIKLVDGVYVSILTNGSRTLRWWNEYGGLVDNLTLSLHISQADLDHSIQVADIVYSKGKKVTVQVLMDTECWDRGVQAINYMKENSRYPWMIETKPVVHSTVEYTPEQTAYLKSSLKRYPTFAWLLKNIRYLFNGHIRLYRSRAIYTDGSSTRAKPSTYILSGDTDFSGWSCNIGIESILIDQWGKINGSCGQLLFDANILDTDFASKFNPYLGPIICSMPSCTCLPATHASKFDLGQRNVSRTSTEVPITFYKVSRNVKSS